MLRDSGGHWIEDDECLKNHAKEFFVNLYKEESWDRPRLDTEMGVGRNGPLLTHLLFADDILLVGEASLENARAMKNCLDGFCSASGQKVSPAKSRILFSKNIDGAVKQGILNVNAFQLTNDLGRYLGMPLLHGRVSRSQFAFIMEKVNSRLAGWKTSCLSMAGRTAVAKSVVSSIPFYAMQSMRIPKSISLEVERMQRNFIWGHDHEHRKAHPIGWSTLCKPKGCGGLGFRRMELMNSAFLMKLGWKFMTEKDNLCCQVMVAKYGRNCNLTQGAISKTHDSVLWKELVKLWPQVRDLQRWCVGDGSNIYFWTDKVGGISTQLTAYSRGPLSENDLMVKVADFGDGRGSWNLEALGGWLCWSLEAHGRFSVRSAYRSLTSSGIQDSNWKIIWRLKAPERVKIFLWQALHNRLLTKFRCRRWNGNNTCCPWCVGVIEDEDWFDFNLAQVSDHRKGAQWVQCWAIGTWFLWGWRNKALHDDSFSRHPRPRQLVREFVGDYNKAVDPVLFSVSSTVRTEVLVSWEKPGCGWVKVNSDGAVKRSSGKAGYGAILRDEDGSWVGGVCNSIVTFSVLKAEAWGALEGLRLASDLGVPKVILECDSKCLVDGIKSTSDHGADVQPLFLEIRSLLAGFTEVLVQHRWRQANVCADWLANLGASKSQGRLVLSAPPVELKQLMLADVVGSLGPATKRVLRAGEEAKTKGKAKRKQLKIEPSHPWTRMHYSYPL
ncbi:ribonuclease H [Senna tora]|uniref:Ribonuclease H n=1 Tax=Senna tora TaxID=362788 RepID=A0A834T191_9FABA|nr:ribonuclease H [Senna tora]